MLFSKVENLREKNPIAPRSTAIMGNRLPGKVSLSLRVWVGFLVSSLLLSHSTNCLNSQQESKYPTSNAEPSPCPRTP